MAGALIVGDIATHGKGTVQAVIDLGDQLHNARPGKLGALRLTMQQFYRVNGDSTQNRGVLSDIVLPSVSEYLSTPEKEMEYALPFDRVRPADHQGPGMVPSEVKTTLKDRSAVRVQASKDFRQTDTRYRAAKSRLKRKSMPLERAGAQGAIKA